eukprot:scaffold21757_cov183-Isochrysis_galbana.AAC.1
MAKTFTIRATHAPPPKLYQGYRKVWQALGTLTVDNIIKSETEGFFTDEDNDQYLTPYLTQIDGPKFRFDGKIYDRYKFLASWERIKSHVIQHYVQHISHEPWPGYNEVARKMERWYHYDPRDGTGLGKREQGTLVPIDPAPTAFAHRANPNKNSSKRPPRADVR